MGAEDKELLFERMPLPKAVQTLSIPTILTSLVMVIYNLSDTYFVGMLSDPVQNAAVTLAAPLLLAFNAVNNLFGVGSSSMMSRALGRKDYETVYRSSAFGFYCALLCGVLFSLGYTLFRGTLLGVLGASGETLEATAGYLLWTVSCGAAPAILNVVMAYLVRAEGATLHASIGTMSGCLLNIVLDPIFILPWGLDMGAAGAGLATCISNCAACAYFFVLLYLRRGKTCVRIGPSSLKLEKSIVLGVCAVGIPASIQNLLNVTGMTVLNNFTAGYGSSAVAAMGIAQKINMVPMYIAQGFSQGLMPLVSYNYASGGHKRMESAVRLAAGISTCFLAVVTLVYFLAAGPLVTLFIDSGEVVAYGTRFLRGMCIGLPFLSLDFLAVGVFQACGMGSKSLIFALLRKIVLEIPALFVLDRLFPLYGLAYAQPAAEILLSAAAICVLAGIFRRLNSGERSEGSSGT